MQTEVNRPLRVAFVDYVLEPDKPGRSGLSDVVWDMASELVNQGHEAHIIASYHTDKYPDGRVHVHNFPTPPIGYRNLIGKFWILKRASDIAKRLQPDIIHAPEYVSTALFATLGISTPLVLTTPGNIFQRLRKGHNYEWLSVQVLKWAARTSARHCAYVIAISKEMKRWWEWTGTPPERTPWIPYGIDPRRFHPVVDAKTRLGIKSPLFFLYVGRFSKEKGLFDLLSALNQIRTTLKKHVHVRLIGAGPLTAQIKEEIDYLDLNDFVTMQHWVAQEELPTWYSAADALLMPSWNEPLGRVMLEAMACGTPVVASETEGPKDHISHGENGFLFAPRDTEALATLLEQLIQQPEVLNRISSAALAYVKNNLIWGRIMKRIEREVYMGCLNLK